MQECFYTGKLDTFDPDGCSLAGVARFVCEALVHHLNLFDNMLVWSESLNLVQEKVGGVHYKGCRDLMKLLFDKFDHLPRQIPEEHLVALLKGQKVSYYNYTISKCTSH